MYTWVGEDLDGEDQARAFRVYYDERLVGRVVETDTGFYDVFVDDGGEEVQVNEGLVVFTEARALLQDRILHR